MDSLPHKALSVSMLSWNVHFHGCPLRHTCDLVSCHGVKLVKSLDICYFWVNH